MTIKLLSILTIALITLNACGGGSSSSGSGELSSLIEDDGVYKGTQTLQISGPDGELVDSQEFAFDMSVFQNNVTISDTSFFAQTSLDDGVFVAHSGEILDAVGDISCNLTIIYTGEISNGSAQGTLQGNHVCRQVSDSKAGAETSFSVDGDFHGVSSTLSSKISLINNLEIDITRLAKSINNAH